MTLTNRRNVRFLDTTGRLMVEDELVVPGTWGAWARLYHLEIRGFSEIYIGRDYRGSWENE
jgi:hypothetical protein